MAEEIEIKLAVPPTTLAKVAQTGWLLALLEGPVARKELRSVYFDTADGALKAQGLTLRIRHSGARRIQTVKALGDSVLVRQEWEGDIVSDTPDLECLPPAAQSLFAAFGGPYSPVFETAVTRTILPLRSDGAKIEMALDHGVITAGERQAAISEIEIECQAGPRHALIPLALRLAEEFDARLDLRPKSQRGYALAAGEALSASSQETSQVLRETLTRLLSA